MEANKLALQRKQAVESAVTKPILVEDQTALFLEPTTQLTIVPTRKTEEIKERLKALNNGEVLVDSIVAFVPKSQFPFVQGVYESTYAAGMRIATDIVAEAIKDSGQYQTIEKSHIETKSSVSETDLILSDQSNNFQPVSFEGGNDHALVYIESQQFRFDGEEPLLQAPPLGQELTVLASGKALTKVVELRRAIAIVEEGSNLAEVLRNVKPVQRLADREVEESNLLDKAA